jgi:hypothetical protein
VLKKVGIVVATAAAGLLAVSPLAFAGSKDDHHGHNGHGSGDKQVNSVSGDDRERSSSGLINVDALNGDILNENNVNVCDVNVQVLSILPINEVTAALGILGPAEAENSTVCAGDSSDNVEQENND